MNPHESAKPPTWTEASPWSLAAEDVLEHLGVAPAEGLSHSEAERRLREWGPNTLEVKASRSVWTILILQFKGLLAILLAAAGAISFSVGDWVEGSAIVAVLIVNGILGFVTEWRAIRSMEALRTLGTARVTALRGGKHVVLDAEDMVVGDVIEVEAGDLISADMRVVVASKLKADEASLTGESLPTSKDTKPVPAKAFLGDRRCILHKGTAVTRGSGSGVVVATGANTEVGHIGKLVEDATEESTPLERRLDRLGHVLVWVTLGIATFVAVMGIAVGKPPLLIIETAIALAVASVPEGLPILATMTLARGVHRMARKNAVVQRLSAVETLGATSIICTDKTGTLTENKMTVDRMALAGGVVDPTSPAGLAAHRIGVLCNNASLGQADNVGDPLEVALLEAARPLGLDRDELAHESPEVREVAFDTETKMMATVHAASGGFFYAVKGAPENVVGRCIDERDGDERKPLDARGRGRWAKAASDMASDGLRVIALAYKEHSTADAPSYEALTMVALIGLLDPPRLDVAEAIAGCQHAGIDVVMITGDHPETARHISERVGIVSEATRVLSGAELEAMDSSNSDDLKVILGTRVFARVSPEQKLMLIALHQQQGRVVAMTGDGVNDAPALKKADIGVAMGQRGTEVARQSSEVVLLDDAFSTIVLAIREGRSIFRNIRSFVVYLLSCNLSEILVVGLATAARVPLPLLPIQILFLNLVTDVFPALALGACEGADDAMEHAPRASDEPVVGRKQWRTIIAYGLLISFAVLGAFYVAMVPWQLGAGQALTVSFLTLALAQLWHVFNMGSLRSRWFRTEVTRNGYVWAAVVLCIALLSIAVYWPPAAAILHLEALGIEALGLAIAASTLPLLGGAVAKLIATRRSE